MQLHVSTKRNPIVTEILRTHFFGGGGFTAMESPTDTKQNYGHMYRGVELYFLWQKFIDHHDLYIYYMPALYSILLPIQGI